MRTATTSTAVKMEDTTMRAMEEDEEEIETTCGCEDLLREDACVLGDGGIRDTLMLDAPPWPSTSEAIESGHEPSPPPMVPGGWVALAALGGAAATWVCFLAVQPVAARIHVHA